MPTNPWFWIVVVLTVASIILVVLGKGLPPEGQCKYIFGIGGTMFVAGVICAILAVIDYRDSRIVSSIFAGILGTYGAIWLLDGFDALRNIRKSDSEESKER